MEIHFRIAGVLLILLALVHIFFPFYFNWKEEQKSMRLINRQMMNVHMFFVALTVFLMGLLCVTWQAELIETKLGKVISLGFGVFWVSRLVIQFFGYSPALWRGKNFETTIHILFSGLWLYFSFIFLINSLT